MSANLWCGKLWRREALSILSLRSFIAQQSHRRLYTIWVGRDLQSHSQAGKETLFERVYAFGPQIIFCSLELTSTVGQVCISDETCPIREQVIYSNDGSGSSGNEFATKSCQTFFLLVLFFFYYSNSDELTLLSNFVKTSWRCKHQWSHLCEAAKRHKEMMRSVLMGYRNLDFEVCKNQSRFANQVPNLESGLSCLVFQLALLGAARCLGRWRLKVVYRPHNPKRRCFDFLATNTTEQKFAVWTSFHVKEDLSRSDLD